MNELDRQLRARRTVHQFEDRPVPEEIVLEAIASATYAPNHKLTQPWEFILIGKETASAISERNADMLRETKGEAAAQHKLARWNAMPGWMVLTCRNSEDPIRYLEDFAACACAAQNFMLSLSGAGVASKWSTGPVTRDPEFYQLLGLDPNQQQVMGIFWYGYGVEKAVPVRKGVEEVIRRLR